MTQKATGLTFLATLRSLRTISFLHVLNNVSPTTFDHVRFGLHEVSEHVIMLKFRVSGPILPVRGVLCLSRLAVFHFLRMKFCLENWRKCHWRLLNEKEVKGSLKRASVPLLFLNLQSSLTTKGHPKFELQMTPHLTQTLPHCVSLLMFEEQRAQFYLSSSLSRALNSQIADMGCSTIFANLWVSNNHLSADGFGCDYKCKWLIN